MTYASGTARAIERSLIEAGFTGNVARDLPLARHTSYGIGGPAALFVEIPTVDDLKLFKEALGRHEFPLLILGAGTNILISDDGFVGTVARLTGEFTEMEISEEGIRAGSAVPVTRVVREGARIGLDAILRLVGIPGWIGGAIAMNAGTFGEYIDGILDSIHILTKDNETQALQPEECEFGYRTSRFLRSGEIILDCSISSEIKEPELVEREVQRRLERRKATQPIDLPSCGCVFRNPPGEKSAARLIQEAGLKGVRRGAAVISDTHSNFVVNEGGAKAIDVLELMALARKKVRELFGITLMPEVRAYGFPAALEVMLDAIDGSMESEKNK